MIIKKCLKLCTSIECSKFKKLRYNENYYKTFKVNYLYKLAVYQIKKINIFNIFKHLKRKCRLTAYTKWFYFLT